METDFDYYTRRLSQSEQAAKSALDPYVANAHYDMARLYRNKLCALSDVSQEDVNKADRASCALPA